MTRAQPLPVPARSAAMDAVFFRAWLAEAAAVVESQRDHLTQLDAAIGDADHGINLARGFSAVTAALEQASTPSPGSVLTLAGSTLISKVGGASGPLYGMAFRQAGKSLGSTPQADLHDLASALEAALAGVQKLGAAREGEKTMVDALAPAVSALGKAIAEGAPAGAALSALADAAASGAPATISMQALKGRASYLGPRSVGHEDPAAASAAAVSAATPAQVEAAFAAVAADRRALAEGLRASGRTGEADIVAIAALIAADRVLVDAAVAATWAGRDAAIAVHEAAEVHAAAIAAIPNPELAERAADVRQVAVAVLDHLAGGHRGRPAGPIILVRRDVAAADLIELAECGLVGAVSVAGGASSHAAIIARGLGIPLVTGVGEAALAGPAGQPGLLDADAGELVVGASPA